MTATFAEWIAPLSLADFRAKAAAARLFPITGALGGGANAPLPWTLIERLQYEDVVQADHFYLGLRGVAVPKSVYRNPAGALRPGVVRQFVEKGANVVFDRIEQYVPEIDKVAAELASALNARVGVNAYLTFGPVSVFFPHADEHNVLAVQLYGAKNWLFYDGPQATTPGAEQMLRPGHLLFVPKGQIHEAVPLETPSVHLSFGIASLDNL